MVFHLVFTEREKQRGAVRYFVWFDTRYREFNILGSTFELHFYVCLTQNAIVSFDLKCNLALPSFGCMLCSFCLITASFIFGLCWVLVDVFCKENVLTDLCTYFTAMNIYLVTYVHFLCSCFSLCFLTVSSSNFCTSHEAQTFSFCDYTAA